MSKSNDSKWQNLFCCHSTVECHCSGWATRFSRTVEDPYLYKTGMQGFFVDRNWSSRLANMNAEQWVSITGEKLLQIFQALTTSANKEKLLSHHPRRLKETIKKDFCVGFWHWCWVSLLHSVFLTRVYHDPPIGNCSCGNLTGGSLTIDTRCKEFAKTVIS